MTVVFKKAGDSDIDTHRTPCESESRGQGGVRRAKEQQSASRPPETRRITWSRFFLIALSENYPCGHFDLGLLVSRSVR